jgi:circadian clock protein KaiC
MPHSNQVREFTLSEKGVQLTDVYIGEGRVFTGSARQAQEARDRADALARRQDIERKRRDLEGRMKTTEMQFDVLRTRIEQDRQELDMILEQEKIRDAARTFDRRQQSEVRKADQAEEEGGAGIRRMKKAS